MIKNLEQVLEQLFESVPKARLLRLFVRNPDYSFTFRELTRRSQTRPLTARKELKKLVKLGLVGNKTAVLEDEVARSAKSKRRKSAVRKKRTLVYYTDHHFRLFPELRDLVTKDTFASRKKILGKIKRLGRIKLAILSGVFLNSDQSRTDLLIVGDNVKKARLEHFLAEIESEIGRSIQYTVMDTKEFAYRLNMYDKFLRDILEYPHEKLINKLKI